MTDITMRGGQQIDPQQQRQERQCHACQRRKWQWTDNGSGKQSTGKQVKMELNAHGLFSHHLLHMGMLPARLPDFLLPCYFL